MNAELYKERGLCYKKLGKEKNAKEDFEKAYKLNPSIDVPIEKPKEQTAVVKKAETAEIKTDIVSEKPLKEEVRPEEKKQELPKAKEQKIETVGKPEEDRKKDILAKADKKVSC